MEISSSNNSFKSGATLLKRAENQISASAEKSASEKPDPVEAQIGLISGLHAAKSAATLLRTNDQMLGTLLDILA